MPVIHAHLIQLQESTSLSSYARSLRALSPPPLVISKCIRWIIRPESISKDRLLDTEWDLLVIVSSPLDAAYLSRDHVKEHWCIAAGMPGSLFSSFSEANQRLLHPHQGDVPALTGSLKKPKMASSSQGLELDEGLQSWAESFGKEYTGAVSMLNLLAFKPGKEAHESYKRYGAAFAKDIGSKRGGKAKIVGKTIPVQGLEDEDSNGWEEIALAHYPSITHFADMLASEDYQKVNHESRLPSLRDTCILCTVELHPDVAPERQQAKL